MKNTIITLTHEANIQTNGTRTSKNCKAVLCIDTGEVYNSCADAAEAAGVHWTQMSAVCLGKVKTTKGKRYCYMNQRDEYMNVVLARIRELSAMEEKAKLWDAQQAEIEKARKAEEKRLAEIAKAEEEARLAEAKRQKAIEKAKAKVDRLTMEVERKHDLYLAAMTKLENAAWELKDLEENNNAMEMEDVA